MIAQQVEREFQLLEDVFSPAEAKMIMESMLEQVANTYKLQQLSQWVGDHQCDSTNCEYQLEQVARKKEVFQELVVKAAKEGRGIKIDTQVSIRIQ